MSQPALLTDRLTGGAPPSVRLIRAAERWWWAIVGGIVALYAAGYTGRWRIESDSATSLNIARQIANGQGFTHPIDQAERIPPGLPYTLAATLETASGQLWPAHVLMLLIAFATLATTYWLVALHSRHGVALIVTALTAGAVHFYEYAYRLLAEMPFLLGVMLTLVGYERLAQRRPRLWLSIGVLATGLVVMLLFRTVALVVIAGLGLAVVYRALRRRQFALLTGVGALGVALWSLIRWLDPRAGFTELTPDEQILVRLLIEQLPDTLAKASTTNLWQLLTESTSEAVLGVDFGPFVEVPVSLMLLALGLALWRRRPLWGLLVGLFVFQWLIFIVNVRYWLVLLPLMMLACWQGAVALERRLPGRWRLIAVPAVLAVVAVPNLVRVGKFITIQRADSFVAAYRDGKYAGMVATADWLRQHSRPEAQVLIEREYHQELMFLADRTATFRFNQLEAEQNPVYVIQPAEDNLLAPIRRRDWPRQGPLFEVPGGRRDWAVYYVGTSSG